MAIERTEGVADGALVAHGGAVSRLRLLQGRAAGAAREPRLVRESRERQCAGQQHVACAVRERLLHAAACPIRRVEPAHAGRIACLRIRRTRGALAVLVGLVRGLLARLAPGGVR